MGLRTYFRFTLKLRSRDETGMQKWNYQTKTKRVSEQKRDFCSNDENLCK